MLRGEGVVCGTSTTGTGTLTLAATPGPPGGVDFDVLARGLGFANSAAILTSYTIIEYTDGTFATASKQETGIGTLTLGGSSGIANCTLARTTVQATATSLNSQPATYGFGSAITIGTAANTLVFCSPKAAEIPAFTPYFENTLGDALGALPLALVSTSGTSSSQPTSGTDYYAPFVWQIPMLIKRASVRVSQAYGGTTGTPISSANFRIYAVGTNGRPGKLLLDLGGFGTNPLNATGNISTSLHSTGYFLAPGTYFADFLCTYSGATGTVTVPNIARYANAIIPGILGSASLSPAAHATATGGAIGTAPDPANTTSYALVSQAGVGNVAFSLKSS